jgi:hypothetical protein
VEIIHSKPPDWFGPGNLPVLERYIRTVLLAKKLHDRLDKLPLGTDLADAFFRQMIAANNSAVGLAVKLRLTVQAGMTRRQTGRHVEHGSSLSDHPLIGGAAVRMLHVRE